MRRWRQTNLDALTSAALDVLVVGGGIVGAGIARDAAMRGLRTGLIEQHDFASGTSSRSSRLLHGGLRYLAQGRLKLVREASVEKQVIHRIAPHLAEPLPFIFPTFNDNRHWVLWQLKLGVKMYDLLCSGHNFGKSTWLRVDEAARKLPGLRTNGLTGAVRYFDGFTNDSRLTLDTLRSAAAHGAWLLNYCRFEHAKRDQLWNCTLHAQPEARELNIQARAVINATGPWADKVPHSRVKLRTTKGVHLVIPRERLPVPETVVMTEGKRILFAIPWAERTILGTTDTDYAGAPEAVRAEPADVSYVLEIANRFFPHSALSPADVLATWAGVRPLLAEAHGKPSDISRSHQILNPEPGWWDVAGGKLTTYRLIAEQTVDAVAKMFARESPTTRIGPCLTAEQPLLPAEATAGISGIVPPKLSRTAVAHFINNEWAMHLEDIMLRRTGWHYYLAPAQRRAADVAAWMAEFLGWSAADLASELARYHQASSVVSLSPSQDPPR